MQAVTRAHVLYTERERAAVETSIRPVVACDTVNAATAALLGL